VITLWHYLAVAAILFGLGLVGFLTRRNLITMFLSAELMLQGVVINFLAFAKFHANLSGQVMGLMIVAVAACEAGLAMALFIVLYRRSKSLDASVWQDVREAGLPATTDADPLPAAKFVEADPVLAMAGRRPGEDDGGEVTRV
jgi:NADH-quinone oxidoreductase subunit K